MIIDFSGSLREQTKAKRKGRMCVAGAADADIGFDKANGQRRCRAPRGR
jgi:hypothetical protein